MKILVTGWFSFKQMGATAGDLLARDLVCDWLRGRAIAFDVALAAPFQNGVDWHSVDPAGYSHIVFVCGPFGQGWPVTEFLSRFSGCRLIGLNLSVLESLDAWNPFDLLLERDSSSASRPDITFLSQQPRVPVAGIVLVHPQLEYKGKGLHQVANTAIYALMASREMSAVSIDTRLDINSTGLRSPAEVESLIARMDLIMTTRLHGLVLALKNGVPAIAIDPIAGGAKIQRQAKTIGWPIIFAADTMTGEDLQKAFDYCLTEEARVKARQCSGWAAKAIEEVKAKFISGLGTMRRKSSEG